MITIKFILQFIFLFINELLVFKFVFFSYDNKVKINMKIVTILLLISLLTALNNNYSTPELRLIGNYLLGISMFFLVDRANIKKSFFYFSVLMLYGILIELLVSAFLGFFFKSLLELNYFLHPIIILISYLVWFGSWYLLFKNNRIKYLLAKIEEIISKIIKIEILFIILFLILDVILVKHYFNLNDHIFFITAIINLNLLFGLIFLIMKNKIRLKALEASNLYLKNNVELYETIVNDHSIIKHNLIADFLSIRSVADNEVKLLIDEKIKLYNNNYTLPNSINKVPDGLKGLVCMKIMVAKKAGVKVVFESTEFTCKQIYKCLSPKSYLQLCESLDILIDNAIEASLDCKDKYIKISMMQSSNKIIVKIMNPFKNQIDINSLGKIRYSTKNRNSGFGLHSIGLNNQKNIIVLFKIVNDLFISTITFNLKK